MNHKEELLEKIKKIKALADQGVGGEKTTAQAMLERLMQERGITEADLEVERVDHGQREAVKSKHGGRLLYYPKTDGFRV